MHWEFGRKIYSTGLGYYDGADGCFHANEEYRHLSRKELYHLAQKIEWYEFWHFDRYPEEKLKRYKRKDVIPQKLEQLFHSNILN